MKLQQMLKKYPRLKVITGTCSYCKKKIKSTEPFFEDGHVGLRFPSCPCGKGRNQCMTMLPISKEEIEEWEKALGMYYFND